MTFLPFFRRARMGAHDLFFRMRDIFFVRGPATILMYHSISDSGAFTAVHPGEFSWQMAYLADHGYQVISLDALVDSLKRSLPIPSRSVVLTFDDGYVDNYFAAFPVLFRHRYSATIFPVSGRIGTPSALSASHMRDMLASGLISFGAHTVTHPHLTRLSPLCIKAEMADSRDRVANIAGVPCRHFAYPYGDYDIRTADISRTLFDSSVTVRRGSVPLRSDAHTLPRYSVDSLVTRGRFRYTLPL